MAKVFIEQSTLTAIGDAIRNKTGKTELIDPAVMSTEIEAIEAGGGELPEEAYKVSGDCSYRFAKDGWKWFIENYGNKITTENITNLSYAFSESKNLTKIPFVLNVNNCTSLANAFASCSSLLETPKIRGNITFNTNTALSNMLQYCSKVADFEELFAPGMLDGFNTVKVTSAYSCVKPATLGGCSSMREIPSWWYAQKLNEESTAYPNTSYSLYYYGLNNCYNLLKALNIPVLKCNSNMTSNNFTQTFSNCNMLKDLTFETNEGQPIEVNWKAQTIDLTSYVGFCSSGKSNLTKQVKDDETYQALKDTEDWWTNSTAYSRYNHDSAVNTINSLPDTSAYLASAGGTNTIKFSKNNGAKTDGGAIQNLTAEEIAVAAAKGWTVTLS